MGIQCSSASATYRLGGGGRLRAFENRVLWRILWPKRDEVAREWRKLHNEELTDLYSSPNIVRVIESRKWAGHVARMGESRGVYRMLVGKSEGKRPFKRPSRRWLDNIKMGLHDVDVRVWTESIWLRIGTGGGLL
jgi:hypothetical protein